MNKALEALKISEEKYLLLDDKAKVDLIIESYYKIMFSSEATITEKDRARFAYNVLLDPTYKDYYMNISVEEQHGIRR